MPEQSAISIHFYDWEGDACRVHTYPNGLRTADLYRSGEGLVKVEAIDVVLGSKRINEANYKELVMEKILIAKNKGNI